jgi:hypothetical protein
MRRCWGLSSQGIEPLSTGARAHVALRVRRQWRRVGALALTPLASLGVAAAALDALPRPLDLMVGALGFGLLIPAAALLAAGDAFLRARSLAADLARGEVEVFEGTIGVALQSDDALEALEAEGALGDREGTHRAEVLPASGLLHALDGRLRSDFLRPDVLDVASIRPPRPLREGEGATTRAIPLSEKERAELRARSAQHWRTPGAVLLVVGYVCAALVLARLGGPDAWAEYRVQLTLVGIAAAAAVVRMGLRVRTAIRLARDAERGDALEIVEPDEKSELRRVVVLAESGMVWSVDDLPAEWRSDRR